MARRTLSEETRLNVIQAIIGGATYAQAARQYKVSHTSAQNWYDDYCRPQIKEAESECKSANSRKLTPRQMLRKKVREIALASLDGFNRIITTCTQKEYLESQTAGEVAVLADTIANGGVQLTNALAQLGSDPDDEDP